MTLCLSVGGRGLAPAIQSSVFSVSLRGSRGKSSPVFKRSSNSRFALISISPYRDTFSLAILVCCYKAKVGEASWCIIQSSYLKVQGVVVLWHGKFDLSHISQGRSLTLVYFWLISGWFEKMMCIEIDMFLHAQEFKIRNLKINLCHVPSDTLPSCSDLLKHLPDTFLFLFLYKYLPAHGQDFPWQQWSVTLLSCYLYDFWGQEDIWSHHHYHLQRKGEFILFPSSALVSEKYPGGTDRLVLRGHSSPTVEPPSLLVQIQYLMSVPMISDRSSYTASGLSSQPETPSPSKTAAVEVFYLLKKFFCCCFWTSSRKVSVNCTQQLVSHYHHCSVKDLLLFYLFIIHSISFTHAHSHLCKGHSLWF